MLRLEQEEWSSCVEAVLARVRPRLVRTFRVYRIPVADAEDLVQSALLALVTKWTEIREPATWLVGAVRHQCRDYVRHQLVAKTAAADHDELERLAGTSPSGEERIGARIDLERLAESLKPRQRRLLRLTIGLGLDDHELASELGGVKPASLRRARRRLLEELRTRTAAHRRR